MFDVAPDRERIARALAALLGLTAKNAELRRLGGGLGHVSYLVTLAEQSYVLRLKAYSAGPTLELEEEYALLGAVAAAGITPEPLRKDTGTRAMLISFVPRAQSLTEAAAREPVNVARIAELLRRLHGIRVALRNFEPLRHAEDYFAAAARQTPLAPSEQRLASELRTRAVDYVSRYPPSAVCHNDLVAANVLEARDLLLVDFEYAARAAPILDLASLAAMNDFTDDDRRKLLHAYYASSNAPVSPAELADVVRMVRLMAFFWARALPEELRAQKARYLSLLESAG
jgi:Ser/Thr protein kinase RdoA (MazF antagonist)